jgi:tungstate transport system ATP-binding protein
VSIADSLLAVDRLKVALGGIQVLDIPSFQLFDKEILTIVGPNGSGKSTLLLSLAGLIKPLTGKLAFRGEWLDSQDQRFRYRRRISMVFQEPLLFDTTVFKNVAAGLKFRGLSKSALDDGVRKYLQYFRCEHLAGRSARKLSGGESQRISLARAFAIEPEILFLDEPFSSLDPPTRHSLIHDLGKIIRKTGTSTIMVTHVESEALNMSDRIAVMNNGRIIQTGNPGHVMNHPTNEFVAKFAGMETILNGKILTNRDESLVISVLGRELHAIGLGQPGETVTCCIRPEHITLSLQEEDGSDSNINSFTGLITDIYTTGPFLKVSLDCGFPLTTFLTRDRCAYMGLSEGKSVRASFKPEAIYLIHH